MADMKEIYTDIDVVMTKNVYGDVPKAININAVRKALYNRLMIGSYELPFDNNEIESLRDYIHSDLSIFDQKFMTDLITRAVAADPRLTMRSLTMSRNPTVVGTDVLTIKLVCNVGFANSGIHLVDFEIILDNH